MNVFIVAPLVKDDIATQLTVKWANQLCKEIEKLNKFKLVTLLGEGVIRAEVESALEKDRDNPGIFIFIDHGGKKCLYGADEQAIITFDNVDVLKNKFVYAIACKSASEFGHRALKAGVQGYIGFNNSFQIIIPASETFGYCFLSGILGILKDGKCAIDAIDKIRTVTEQVIGKLEINPKIPELTRKITITSLRHNLDFMVCLGDPYWSPLN
ncbi:MAG: hypothetical protein GY795_18240 [Desulfobacterales bacterium]|nr:hypothetical protein [Desulfobacterales bacterium]